MRSNLDHLEAARGRAVQDAVELAADAAYLLVPLQQLLAARMEAQQALHLVNRALQHMAPSADCAPSALSADTPTTSSRVHDRVRARRWFLGGDPQGNRLHLVSRHVHK